MTHFKATGHRPLVILVHFHAGVIHAGHLVRLGLGCLAGRESEHRGSQREDEEGADDSFHGVAWCVVWIPPRYAEKGIGNQVFTDLVTAGGWWNLAAVVAK